MHYYQFNIADYRKDTAHLTPIEHYIYRTLLDWYYLDEKPIPLETQVVIRRLCLGFEYEQNLINVLQDFFIRTEKGYTHSRVEIEILAYHEKSIKNRINGKLGGRPLKTQSVIVGLPAETKRKPKKTQTINHKPITNKKYIPPIPSELYLDYMNVRKAKKAGDLTETAFNGIAREAEKAGISVVEAIKQCCERGWVGFKADWIKEQPTKESQAWRTDDELILKKAKELGVHTTGKSRFEIIAAIDKKRGAV